MFPAPVCRPEISIAFLRDSFKKHIPNRTFDGTPEIGGLHSHTEKRGRNGHSAACTGSSVWVFKQAKNENASRSGGSRTNCPATDRRLREKLNTPAGASVEEQRKVAEAENRAGKAEAELARIQKEKADLQAKLDENQKEIVSLQSRADQSEKKPNASAADSPSATAPAADLQSQLDDLRGQLDAAEKEKAFLSEKLQEVQERAGQPKEGKKKKEIARESSSRRTGLRGTVLAVNQAYNFVVLNLGSRQGVESNAEMLVLRDGARIGKIRISSVEPATAIGDIMSNSLALGAQMQPGDSVIYAGTNP